MFSATYDTAYYQIIATDDPLGNRTTYQYDSVGNLTTMIDALGNVWTSVCDSQHNLTAKVDPLGRRTTYGYNAWGQIISTRDGRGLSPRMPTTCGAT